MATVVNSKTEEQQQRVAAIIAELHQTLLEVVTDAQTSGIEITLRIGPGGYEWDKEIRFRTRHRFNKLTA